VCAPGAVTAQEQKSASLKDVELRYLQRLMEAHGNDRVTVAAIAGISVRSLYRKLQRIAGHLT